MSLEHKVGDTFSYVGTAVLEDVSGNPVSMAGATVASQIRTMNGTKIADLTTTLSDGTMMLRFSGSTQGWPLGVAQIDVQITLPGGHVISTSTANIVIVRDVTRPDT